MKNNKTIAIVPGSFDPITYGHLDIASRAAELYDVVYLAVMINPEKSYMFTLDQRVSIAQKALEEYDNVEVISSEGMLWELAKNLCADAIVKGYRNEIDYQYEMDMSKFNSEHYPQAKTILLKAKSDLESISSTNVRERILNGKPITDCLPQNAVKEIKRFIS